MRSFTFLLRFFLTGIFFGIVLAKAEVVSWYRIQEMFLFDSFHMYGVIGSAVFLGILIVRAIQVAGVRDVHGEKIRFVPKERSFSRYFFGGTIFGLGWSMIGACPGPIFILIGMGHTSYLLVLGGALLGTFTYGLTRRFLPH
jgi:uncharacterized membrane protein YedE/YeeE